MKLVHKPDMVAHLWANQSQPSATNPGRTFYFDGDTIYSYGGHFPIARHVKHKGKSAILFTTRKYSNTTAKHISMVRQAIKEGTTVFYVQDVYYSNGRQLEYFAKQIKESEAKAEQANKPHKAGWKRSACNIAAVANEYAKFFGLKKRFKSSAPTDEEIKAETEYNSKKLERQAKAEETRTRNRYEAYAKQKAEQAERLEKWLAGENVTVGWFYGDETRLRIKDGQVQTSKGAQVPLEHALRILPFVRAGKAWKRNGQEIRIGHFHLDEIDEHGNIKAGCHTISRAELERLAATIGA